MTCLNACLSAKIEHRQQARNICNLQTLSVHMAAKATAKVLSVKQGDLQAREMFAFVEDHGSSMNVTLTDAREAWRASGG